MLTKISSMLDAIADSLENKGLIKEAYEIDKVADEVDKNVDIHAQNIIDIVNDNLRTPRNWKPVEVFTAINKEIENIIKLSSGNTDHLTRLLKVNDLSRRGPIEVARHFPGIPIAYLEDIKYTAHLILNRV